MKTLNDDITLSINVSDVSEGYIQTTVRYNNVSIFKGDAFIMEDQETLEMNINDFVIQNRGKYDYLKLNNAGKLVTNPFVTFPYGDGTKATRFLNGQIGLYTFVATIDSSTTRESAELVLSAYDYENKDLESVLTYPISSDVTRLMQGSSWTVSSSDGIFNNLLLPHYPAISTDKYGVGIQLVTKQNDDSTNWELTTEKTRPIDTYELGVVFRPEMNALLKNGQTFVTLKDLFSTLAFNNDGDTHLYLKKSSVLNDVFGLWSISDQTYYGNCPIAILDACYSRYYLAWNDRYGDIQSQAFDGKFEYSEDIESTEIQDYKMKRRVITHNVQPKWKLRTKWINQDVYPMYEAMFTSPYLLLYDTQTDRSWNVILTDTEYKEKTYKTERSLINLEITLEANKKQNYIF